MASLEQALTAGRIEPVYILMKALCSGARREENGVIRNRK